MAHHTVQAGDCFSSIAYAAGFSPETLWKHADNAALRSLRANPHVLQPGDVVVIPDKRDKQVDVATGQRHIFRRKGVPAQLRLLLKLQGQPRAGCAYRLEFDDGGAHTGQTDAQGLLQCYLSPAVRSAVLHLDSGEQYQLAIGHLLPASNTQGVRSRLLNLQYLATSESDDAALERALRTFQAKHNLPQTGIADQATRARLIAVHGS